MVNGYLLALLIHPITIVDYFVEDNKDEMVVIKAYDGTLFDAGIECVEDYRPEIIGSPAMFVDVECFSLWVHKE